MSIRSIKISENPARVSSCTARLSVDSPGSSACESSDGFASRPCNAALHEAFEGAEDVVARGIGRMGIGGDRARDDDSARVRRSCADQEMGTSSIVLEVYGQDNHTSLRIKLVFDSCQY